MKVIKLIILSISITAMIGCSTPSDEIRRAANFNGFRGAAAYLASNPDSRPLEDELGNILTQSINRSGLNKDQYLINEYSSYLNDPERSLSLDDYLYMLNGIAFARNRNIASDSVYKTIAKEFKNIIEKRFVAGEIIGFEDRKEIARLLPEIVEESNLIYLKNKSMNDLSLRNKNGFDYEKSLISLVDKFGSKNDIMKLKDYLSYYTVSSNEISFLMKTESFKVDFSKFSKTVKLGEFHITEISKFDPKIQSNIKVLTRDFKDPDNVKFRNVVATYVDQDVYVCGELNGVNSYGAFVGYKAFLIDGSGFIVESDTTKIFSKIISPDCALKNFRLNQFAQDKTMS